MQEKIFKLLNETDKKIIIFSNDCTGGRLMKDYKLPQYSPMVNIWYSGEDFLKICENPDKYFHGNIDEISFRGGVPVAKIDDVILNLGHEHDLKTPLRKWKKGCIHYHNAIQQGNTVFCVVANDRNNFKFEMMRRFDALPYKYKIIFTHAKCDSPNSFYMQGEDKRDFVDTMTNFENLLTIRRRYDRFDFYHWFLDMLTE